MKRFSLALVMILLAFGVAHAQKPVKGSYTKAQSFLNKGEIAEAKKYIDAATDDEKLAGKSKTWLVKGMVYQAIALSEDEAIKSLAPNAFDEALASYKKVREMEKEGSSIMKELDETQGVDPNTFAIRPSITQEFRDTYFQKGVDAYEAENYEKAMKSFKKCYKIMYPDTLAGVYALTCAQIAEVDEGVEEIIKDLQGMDYHNASLYVEWARYEYRKAAKADGEEAKKGWEKVLEIAKMGKEKNPENIDLVKFMTDAYIRLDRKKDAIASLQKSIDADPNDKIAYFSMGTLQDELKNYDEAEKAFTKAVEVDPEYFDAYFNFFVMYNNQTRAKVEEINALIDTRGQYTDKAKAEKLEKEIKELRTKSLEVLKKAQAIQPDNTTVKENIEFLETQLKK